jgi:hypothetical protein
MRTAFLLILGVRLALAQVPFMVGDPVFNPLVSSGSSGPTITALATNGGLNVVGYTNSITVPSGATALFWFIDSYKVGGGTPNTPTWIGSSTGVSCIGYTNWYNQASDMPMWIYKLDNPTSGSSTSVVTFASARDELCVTIAAASGSTGLNTISTNGFYAGSNSATNSNASASGELCVAYFVGADSPMAITLGTGQTKLSAADAGSGHHQAFISTKAGRSGTVTNEFRWTGNPTTAGILSFDLKP